MNFHILTLTMLLVAGYQRATEPRTTAAGRGVQVQVDSTVTLQVADYPLGPIDDADGNLWLGSVGSGAMMWNGEELRYFHVEDGLDVQ